MKETTARAMKYQSGLCHPFQSIAVIYCTSSFSGGDREIEKLADCEVIEVAHAVKVVLQELACRVDLVDLDPERIMDLRNYDWVFNLAESIDGFPMADYEVADQMESLRINFTGSGSRSLKACLNKAVTKTELVKNGIRTPLYHLVPPGGRIESACPFPVIVKPVHEDGSIGISSDSVARQAADLARLVERIHRVYRQPALVEEFIEGRDITVSILGNEPESVAFPPSETIHLEHDGSKFITFAAKWVEGSPESQLMRSVCPCEINPKVEAEVKATALRAYRVMGCRDYARIDFRLNGNTPYVLEVNPNPCLNPDGSSFIRSARVSGYTYREVIVRILESSLNIQESFRG